MSLGRAGLRWMELDGAGQRWMHGLAIPSLYKESLNKKLYLKALWNAWYLYKQ